MINLLPTDDKSQIRAARINVALLRYIVIALISFAFLLLALVFSYYILTTIKTSAQSVLTNNHVQVQASTQASSQVQQLQNSLASVKVTFDQSVDYTKVLTNIASLVPPGVVISSLNLTASSFSAPTTLVAFAKTSGGATELQTKLQASPFFSSVALQSVTSNSTDPAYPVSATFSVTLNRSIAQ